jgi:ABC-type transport system involved in multi-copper enzyme maturation permease subunit
MDLCAGGLHVRLGPGPVFAYEWLTTTRRWQLYALRAGFVGVILAGMMLVWQNVQRSSKPGQRVSIQTLASYGESLYLTVVSIELTLVIMGAPAATAGAVCLDKARGTLEHMLATDLSNAEIVLGKLGVRLVPVLGLIACTLPVAALGGLLGGVDPTALFGSFLTAIACAVLGCSLALTLSVWGRKTHEVLMITYLILILWLASPLLVLLVAISQRPSFPGPPPRLLMEWLGCTNPYYLAVAPYTDPGKVGITTYLGFLGVCLGLSAALLVLATRRIRGVALKQASQGAVSPRHGRFTLRVPRPRWLPHLPGPSLDGNPVLWREWHRSKQSRFLRAVWFLYTALGMLWIVLSVRIISSMRGELQLIGAMNMFQVAVGLLLLSASAATSLAEERLRGSLDVLLSTPLSTRSILAGKWLGSFQQVAHVLVWPAITAGLLAADSGRWIHYLPLLGLILAYGAAITSLGLALATWVSRLDRAVALCVSAYIAFSIGWLVVIVLLSSGPGPVVWSLFVGSPLAGPLFATHAVSSGPHIEMASIMVGTLLWTLIHGGVAALLFAATVDSFDRCLGRASETTRRPIKLPLGIPLTERELDLDEWTADHPAEVS